jgi:cytochrome c-type biogenesis protein CcmH/NrfG
VVLAQTAVKQAPDSAEVTAILGQALMSAGRTAEGKEALEMAAHLAENNHPEYQKALIAQLRRGLSGS